MPGRSRRRRRWQPICIILDLEDAVAPDAKETARGQVVEAVKAGGFGSREVVIRINGLDTAWGSADLTAAVAAAPDAILVPKVSSPTPIEAIGQRLLDMHADARTRIWVMIETPLAIFNAPAIAACAKDTETRLACFVMGTNDLAKETRARLVPGRWPMVPWLMTCIAAARIYGVDVLDGVHNDIADETGFAEECAQARDMGFDGKTLIHPKQVGPCNEAFTPPPQEIAQARAMIAAFDLPENQDKGVVMLDGRMVERMHADIARRTVAIAEAIAARGS